MSAGIMAEKLLGLLESDIPITIQHEIIKIWKECKNHEWAEGMPLCIPGPSGNLPDGWMSWMIQALPGIIDMLTRNVPSARLKSITLPLGMKAHPHRLDMPQISVALEVDQNIDEVPELQEELANLKATRVFLSSESARYEMGPGRALLLDVSLTYGAWDRRRKRIEQAAKEAVSVESTPVQPTPAGSGSDEDIPF